MVCVLWLCLVGLFIFPVVIVCVCVDGVSVRPRGRSDLIFNDVETNLDVAERKQVDPYKHYY